MSADLRRIAIKLAELEAENGRLAARLREAETAAALARKSAADAWRFAQVMAKASPRV